MVMRAIILGFYIKTFLDITTGSRDTSHRSRPSCVIIWQNWQNFALVTVQCAVYMERYKDSVIVLLHNAKLPTASHCCLYKFSPKHSPI